MLTCDVLMPVSEVDTLFSDVLTPTRELVERL